MSKVNIPEDVFKFINTHNNDPSVCWEWIGTLAGRDERGYFSIEGKRKLCHRVVYELYNGPIPEGMVIRHKCDHTHCCNPTHLEIGTRSQNEQDKYERNRAGYPLEVLKTITRFGRFKMKPKDICVKVHEEHGIIISASGVEKVLKGKRRAKQTSIDEANGIKQKNKEE